MEALESESAGVASATGPAILVGVVATVRDGIIDAELHTGEDCLCLCHIDYRGMNFQAVFLLSAGDGCEVGEGFERLDVFVPAVRVAAEISGIEAGEYIEGAEDFGPGEGIAEEYGISCGDISERDRV